jgi:Zn-dependent protease
MEMNEENKQDKKKPLWLLSVIGLFLITKGKSIFLLLKASKFAGVLISMLVSIWAYALLFPVGFSIGLVIMILIHEMGHVIAAKQKGLPVSAPMFIPFLGAFISMKKYPRDAITEAYVAMGGPILGTLGAALTLLLGLIWNNELLVVIANVGFFINLLNLLPIHPLDGGRISTAVTRWLWVVGLIGGLVVVYYLRSPLIFIIWALFAWEMYQKYVKNKGRGKQYAVTAQIEVPFEYMYQQGMIIPGEDHKRELAYQTYSTLSGQQKVEIRWESLGIRQTINMPQQGLIQRVHVKRIQHEPKESPTKLILHCEIEYEFHENDKYFDVPASTRWNFGVAYGGLALFLLYMLYVISKLDIINPV